jgi:NagD protein
MRLSDTRHWLFDLDGTTYLGQSLLPGVADLLSTLEAQGKSYAFITNNSSASGPEYEAKLRDLGLSVRTGTVFTSGEATALWLREHSPGARVFLLGTPSLRHVLESHGVALDDDRPDTLVLGFDTTLTYDRLARACLHLAAGCRYVATHPDPACPTPEGLLPDAGSFIALIEKTTGRVPEAVIGKPNPEFLRVAAARAGVPLEQCILVGDRVETDIKMARATGIPAVLTLTGVTRERAGEVDTGVLIVEQLTELLPLLQPASPGRAAPQGGGHPRLR